MLGRQEQHPWTNLEIDAARLAPPTLAEVAVWAGSQRVFISSVMTMLDERAAAIAAVEALGATPVAWERQIAPAPVPAETAWLGGVDTSTILLALLSTAYGTRTHSGNSATHEEFLHAETIGIDRRVYVDGAAAPGSRDGALERWLADIQPFYGYYRYRDPADLGASIQRSLTELASVGLYRWIKVGQLVIRADRHHLSAPGSAWSGTATGSLHIEGQVANPALLASLSEISHRRDRVPVVIDGQLFTGSFESLVETSERGQAGYAADLRLEAPQVDNGLMWTTYAVGGRTWSPAEQADLVARQVLGLTRDPGPTGSVRSPIDWPAVVGSARQLPALIEIAAGLVGVEALIRSGAFTRVTTFEVRHVGPPAGLFIRVRGTRSLGQGLPQTTAEESGSVSLG